MNTLKNILILILTLFAVIPQGCVTGPDGITRMDPTAKALLSSAAKTASLVGLTFAIGEIPILQPFAPKLSRGISDIFDTREDPKEIGNDLKALFAEVALEVGNDELNKLLMEYVSRELVSEIPASSPDAGAQYRYNSSIADSFGL